MAKSAHSLLAQQLFSVVPATAMEADGATESHETLRVMVLEWLSERGHALELQRQCEEHRASGKVRAPPAFAYIIYMTLRRKIIVLTATSPMVFFFAYRTWWCTGSLSAWTRSSSCKIIVSKNCALSGPTVSNTLFFPHPSQFGQSTPPPPSLRMAALPRSEAAMSETAMHAN